MKHIEYSPDKRERNKMKRISSKFISEMEKEELTFQIYLLSALVETFERENGLGIIEGTRNANNKEKKD